MIQKIKGQNFEGYEEFEVEFSEGVNIFIGESDKGKSAVFNLFEWIRTNRPLGDGFRSEWGGDTIGEVWTTDDHYIKRVKTNSKNEYWINDTGPLTGFGHNPPDEVKEILMMDDVNVQIQDEPPFLLKETSGGEIARILNKAASLDDIDLSISNLTKGLKDATRRIQMDEEQLEDQENQLAEYPDLKLIETKIEEIENFEKCQSILLKKKSKLLSLSRSIDDISDQLKETEHLEEIEKRLPELKRLQKERDKKMERLKALEQWQRNMTKLENVIDRQDGLIEKMEKDREELVKLLPPNCPLCGSELK
jgi:hypothetical protein